MRQARRVLRDARAQVLAGTVLGIGCRAVGSDGIGALLERPADVAGQGRTDHCTREPRWPRLSGRAACAGSSRAHGGQVTTATPL